MDLATSGSTHLIGVRPQARSRPLHESYDVVIVGGATSGWSIAWHLLADTAFEGRVLVVERDSSLRHSATAASNNCMRHLRDCPDQHPAPARMVGAHRRHHRPAVRTRPRGPRLRGTRTPTRRRRHGQHQPTDSCLIPAQRNRNTVLTRHPPGARALRAARAAHPLA